MVDELARRQQWLETHKDWIPCRLPHFSIKDNSFYFLDAKRPVLSVTSSSIALIEAIDGRADGEAILHAKDTARELAQLWAAGIATVLPPDTSETGPHIVAIEPHLDDVALSVGGALLLRRDTARKTVLTVASRSNATFYMATPELRYFDVDLISNLRMQETLLVTRFLKARHQTLGGPDIGIRYIDPQRYLEGDIKLTMREYVACRHSPPPASAIEDVATMLWEALQEIAPDEIWMPLGLGNHFDHRLTRDACLDVLSNHWDELKSVKLMFYEDMPYAWDYPGTADAVAKMLHRRGAEMKRQSVDIESVLADKIECLRIYASQFEIDEMRPAIEGYARLAASPRAGHAETLWQLTRAPSSPFAPIVLARGMPGALLEDTARPVFARRTQTRRLGLLIAHEIRDWVEQAQLLLELFPDARIDVLASSQDRNELAAMDDPRLRISLFDDAPKKMLFALIKWAAHFNDAVLVFGGPRRVREAQWLCKMLPSRHAYAFENLADMCVLWRYWLAHRRNGPPDRG